MKIRMAATHGRSRPHRWSSPTREQTVFIGLEYSPRRLLLWQSLGCGVVEGPTERAALDAKCLSGWGVFSHPAGVDPKPHLLLPVLTGGDVRAPATQRAGSGRESVPHAVLL